MTGSENIAKKTNFGAQFPHICARWVSVRFRGLPPGSAVIRCARISIFLLIAPILHRPTNTRRFETTETLGIVGGWGERTQSA